VTRPGVSVAIVGPDGAGKSTVSRRVVAELGRRAFRIYMGVNLDESNVVLPTTRLLLVVKRRRGARPDLTGSVAEAHSARQRVREGVRLLNLIAEEWYRALIAGIQRLRGRTVIMDRHFLPDYWRQDAAPPPDARRSAVRKLHGWLLRTVYPEPDHYIFLDAPPSLLLRRKDEAGPEYLQNRRDDYVAFGREHRNVTVVDTDRDVDEVVDACLRVVDKVQSQRSALRRSRR